MRRAPMKNISANMIEIMDWPNPNIIPARFPFLIDRYRAPSSDFEYSSMILFSIPRLLTVL